MATIKSYTNLEQSKKLAEILPLESADMHFLNDKHAGCVPYLEMTNGSNPWLKGTNISPSWSLASLLGVLPEGTRLLKATNISSIGDTKYHCDCPKGNIDVWFDNPVDACYSMIIKLKELNLL